MHCSGQEKSIYEEIGNGEDEVEIPSISVSMNTLITKDRESHRHFRIIMKIAFRLWK